ncbi:MAG: hypothetical protein JO102_03455, partial [Elusimicrobia bacterium]|nr:hypothetical protein [Elusimicrobiota bacterium]
MVDVDPSNFARFNIQKVDSVHAAYYNPDGSDRRRAASGAAKSLDVLEAAGGLSANMAAEAIGASLRQGAGILVGSPREAVLRTAFRGYLESHGGAQIWNEISGPGRATGIRSLVEAARAEAVRTGNGDVLNALARVEVIDGQGSAESTVKRLGPENLVVFATEVGLRALSYDVKGLQQADLLLAGTEGFTTESYLQALARVDRGTSSGARRLVVPDRSVLENRVETALRVDDTLKASGRTDGLFGRSDAPMNGLLQRAKAGEKLSIQDMMQLGAAFTSLENRAASAQFFVNEQISSKLLKEPLQRMLAQAATPAERAAINEVYLDVLGHSDRENISQGAEYRDPRDIVVDAFVSGARSARESLLRIANNQSISTPIRAEAAARILDLAEAVTGIRDRAFQTDAHGLHSDARYRDTAFVHVSENGWQGPARVVADVVIGLSDFILSNTSTSKAPMGIKDAPTHVYSDAAVAAARAPGGGRSSGPSGNAFADSLERSTFTPPQTVATTGAQPGQMLTPQQQVVARGYQAFVAMSDDDRRTAAHQLYQAGLLPTDLSVGKEAPDARVMAHQLSVSFAATGMRPTQFNLDRVLGASAALAPIINVAGADPAKVQAAVVQMATAADPQEAMAQILVSWSASGSPMAPGTEPILDMAQTVVSAKAQQRDNQARLDSRPTGSSGFLGTLAMPLRSIGFAAGSLYRWATSPDRQLRKLGNEEVATFLPAPAAPTAA